MGRALELARRAWGRTHPNPMVGALIVEGGEVVAEGFHAQDGGPHAERVALAALGRAPKPGAVLFVTLEPCSTHGRTGACCDAIVSAGLRQVVVGATDPNPAHAGRGLERLRAQGVSVRSGVAEAECRDLNLIFNHWIVKKRPFIAGKVAMTLDGKIACRTGDSQWITGEAARADGHRWRKLFPSIMVGAGTVLADNPSLTLRLNGEPEDCGRRFIFDTTLRTAAMNTADWPRVYSDRWKARTIVVTTSAADAGTRRRLEAAGVELWVQEAGRGPAAWAQFSSACAAANISGVYVEGGSQLLSSALAAQALDYLFCYQAPVFFADSEAMAAFTGQVPGSPSEGMRLVDLRRDNWGDDALVRGRLNYHKA
ncbi:riboflavin biosynthesis protein RibD [Verrucomicrobia bacterium IMCC26134]|nr:riboflavin biosynthesis protein RibD [Verrucomicrobia bacterium IMCC26134]